ncbi:MAG: hypothetical protein NTX50_20250 [Candidatus Sumerlaeota bacterium]|nr:hypothetical protein [Candidatus Sumerlaeota bacterium]
MNIGNWKLEIGNWALRLAPLMALLAFAGCAGPIHPSGFLPDYSELKRVKKIDFYLTMDKELPQITTPSVIAIHRAHWGDRHAVDNPQLAQGMEEQLEQEAYYAVLLCYPSPVIITRDTDLGPYLRQREGVYRLDLAVTETDPGIGWLRYFIGYYAGSVTMQAEFCLRDASTNRLIASYATRRLHPGEAQSGLNPLAMSGRRTLQKLIPEISRDTAALTYLILAGEKDLYQPEKSTLFEPRHRPPKAQTSQEESPARLRH